MSANINSDKLVSAILPVYNTSKYLKQCLDSVVTQTYKNLEIICVNDGSTDDSLKMLEMYASKDSRIKIITQVNAGLSAARDTGFNNASGDYVIYIDSDDYVEKEMIEAMLERAESENVEIVICNSNEYMEDANRYIPGEWMLDKNFRPKKTVFSYKDYPETIYQICSANVWTKLYRMDFLKKHNLMFGKYRYIEDIPFTYYSMVLAEKMSIVDSVFYHYRINRIGALTVKPRENPEDYLRPFLDLKDRLVEMGVYETVKRSYVNRFFRSLFWEYGKMSEPEIFEGAFKYMQNTILSELEIDEKCSEDYFYVKDDYSLYYSLKNESLDGYLYSYAVKNFNDIIGSRGYKYADGMIKFARKVRAFLVWQMYRLKIWR